MMGLRSIVSMFTKGKSRWYRDTGELLFGGLVLPGDDRGFSWGFGGGFLTMSGLNLLLVGSILVVICPVSMILGIERALCGAKTNFFVAEGIKGDDESVKLAAGVRTRS